MPTCPYCKQQVSFWLRLTKAAKGKPEDPVPFECNRCHKKIVVSKFWLDRFPKILAFIPLVVLIGVVMPVIMPPGVNFSDWVLIPLLASLFMATIGYILLLFWLEWHFFIRLDPVSTNLDHGSLSDPT